MPEITLIAFLLGGLVILAFAGDFLVNGAVAIARRLGVSPLVAGIFIVGFGTSAPEMVVSLDAALDGRSGIALGNIVGSNIANVLLVLSVPALIAPISAGGVGQTRALAAMLVASAFWIILTATGPLTWPMGVFFLLTLVGYCGLTFHFARRSIAAPGAAGMEFDADTEMSLARALVYVPLGIGGLVIGANLIIEAGVGIAEFYGVPQEWIGLTLLAFGTSLPEIGACVAAALRAKGDVILGNILGSNVFNILGAGGIISLFGPITIAETFHQYDHWAMALAAGLAAVFILSRARIGRIAASVMLVLYVGYVLGLVNAINIPGLVFGQGV